MVLWKNKLLSEWLDDGDIMNSHTQHLQYSSEKEHQRVVDIANATLKKKNNSQVLEAMQMMRSGNVANAQTFKMG